MKFFTLTLLFLFFGFKSLAQQEPSEADCSKFKTGYFSFSDKHDNTIIYRDDEYQIEYNLDNGEWITVKLTWVDPCHYSFVYVATNIKSLKQYIGQTMTVEIRSVDEKGYDYLAVYKPIGKEYYGKIILLERQLKKSEISRIQKQLKKTRV